MNSPKRKSYRIYFHNRCEKDLRNIQMDSEKEGRIQPGSLHDMPMYHTYMQTVRNNFPPSHKKCRLILLIEKG